MLCHLCLCIASRHWRLLVPEFPASCRTSNEIQMSGALPCPGDEPLLHVKRLKARRDVSFETERLRSTTRQCACVQAKQKERGPRESMSASLDTPAQGTEVNLSAAALRPALRMPVSGQDGKARGCPSEVGMMMHSSSLDFPVKSRRGPEDQEI